MKKARGVLLIVIMLFTNIVTGSGFGTEVIYSSEITSELKPLYECRFKAKLDNSFKNTWVYDLSENGMLNLTFQRLDLYSGGIGGGDYLLTFNQAGKETKLFYVPGAEAFGSQGSFNFFIFITESLIMR